MSDDGPGVEPAEGPDRPSAGSRAGGGFKPAAGDAPLSGGTSTSGGSSTSGGTEGFPDITTEDELDGDLVEMVEVGVRLQAERDEYLDMARRVQAEFENYKRRVETQRVEQRARAAEDLVTELLPVLDAGEAAGTHGHEHAMALHGQLLVTLEKLGLQKVDSIDVAFDPNVHEAVLHEEGDSEEPQVAEVMRTGYIWNSRVIRPAMVKVRG